METTTNESTPQFWLAEKQVTNDVVQETYVQLINGPHATIEGVEQAAYAISQAGILTDRELICISVAFHDFEPRPHGLSESLLATLRKVIQRREPSRN